MEKLHVSIHPSTHHMTITTISIVISIIIIKKLSSTLLGKLVSVQCACLCHAMTASQLSRLPPSLVSWSGTRILIFHFSSELYYLNNKDILKILLKKCGFILRLKYTVNLLFEDVKLINCTGKNENK